jgi:hypothetical protein
MDEDLDDFGMHTDTGLPPTEGDVVPRVTSLEDFELCRAVRERGKMTGEFHVVEANDAELNLSGLSGWEVLFVQFRDKKSGEWKLHLLRNVVRHCRILLTHCIPISSCNTHVTHSTVLSRIL